MSDYSQQLSLSAYPGKKNILRIAKTTNIATQNKNTLKPFDIFGSFIIINDLMWLLQIYA